MSKDPKTLENASIQDGLAIAKLEFEAGATSKDALLKIKDHYKRMTTDTHASARTPETSEE